MSTSTRVASGSSLDALAVAIAKLQPVAEVAHGLSVRAEVELPRLPGVVEWARAMADALGLTATVDVQVDGIRVRFTP